MGTDFALAEHAALVATLRSLDRRAGERWSDVTGRLLDLGSATHVLAEWNEPRHLLDDASDSAAAVAAAETDLGRWAAAGWRFLSILDNDYPARLREIHQAPPFVFVEGKLRSDELAVAVVGSRKATEKNLAITAELAARLVDQGLGVLSGLAKGIDATAHRAALDAGGRTIAVIGSGLGQYYPAGNECLQKEISGSGLVLSQFWPEAPPQKHNFLMRNAVMSGIGRCTVVVQAAETSGARAQARMAVEHGRPVILLDEVVRDNHWAQQLVGRPGVHKASTVSQVMSLVSEVIQQERQAGELVRQILSPVA